MFSKSKGEAKRKAPNPRERNTERSSLAQFGLLDVSGVSDCDDDASLEAELHALISGDSPTKSKQPRKMVDPRTLNKMVAECMDDNDGDEDFLDENDPELLAELSALGSDDNEEDENEQVQPAASLVSKTEKNVPLIVHPSPIVAGHSVLYLLEERIKMYGVAEQNALASGETSRARRLSRGLNTLKQMQKNAQSGAAINEEDIPPAVLLQTSRSNSSSSISQSAAETSANVPTITMPSLPPTQTSISSGPVRPAPTTVPSSNTTQSSTSSAPMRTPSSIPQNVIFSEEKDKLLDDTTAQLNTRPPLLPENKHNSPIPSSNTQPPISNLSVIEKRQQEYKLAALKAKKLDDKETALHYMRIAKQLDPLIEAARSNQIVDLASLPPCPSGLHDSHTEGGRLVSSSDTAETPSPQATTVPSNPTSILEALEQRLAVYTEQKEKAKAEGNARKERMNGRIMKQYQDAIRSMKMGRAADLSDLPTPPNFPPLPTSGTAVGTADASPGALNTSSRSVEPPTSTSAPGGSTGPSTSKTNIQGPLKTSEGAKKPGVSPAKPDVRKAPQSHVERQLSLLKKRQVMFKDAALEAKKRGEIEQAKELLRNYKGLVQLIDVASGGLPVDMNTVPIPPQEKLETQSKNLDFEIVEKEDCGLPIEVATEADVAIAFSKLEQDLISQIKMCAQTREHFKAIGDVPSANRFEQQILNTKKDLDAVRVAFKRGDKPPRFHYENRTFTLIQCNTDLNDSDCEVSIVRGLNYNVQNASETDTYVKIEFPYPSDSPPQERTLLVKATNNPEYNHKVVFSIDRKVRSLPRVFKRHSVKCQVINKGGWFHRDSVLGSVKVPLASLETKCTLHESFDLTDDRKKMVGGKLEVKIRVRNPIVSKQLDKVTERWIVIDGF